VPDHAVTGDDDRGAENAIAIDVGLDAGVQPVQGFRVERRAGLVFRLHLV
jgi:hypothetical protein